MHIKLEDEEGEVSEESEDKDGDDNNNDDDDGLSMFCTPNFGDDDFDLNLLGQSKESCFTPQPGNHSNPTDLGYSAPDYWLPAQPIGQFSVMETAVTSQSSFARDSILESLQSIAPKFPSQEDLDIPDISVTNSLNSQPQTFSQSILSTGISVSKMYKQNGQTSLATTARQSPEPRQISPAPSTSSTVSPSKESSEDSDDSLPLAQLAKRQINDEILSTAKPSTKTGKAAAALKKATRVPKKRKKKDPNEPQKPVSAYALFFRDTQSAIKGQNPSASFGEVSKIVASMWEGLDPETKNMYKKRTEMAKKEYLKQLAAYRASLVSQVATDEPGHSPARHSPLGASSHQMMAHMAENPMEGPFGFNNVSPQHMGSPAHNISPHHMPSPLHMPSPQHMGGQQHVTSPVHASSPHHIPSPQHIYSPQHIAASPQHIQNAQHMPSPQHMASPQHMTSPQHATSPQHIPSPQHPAAFTFNNVPHQPSPLAADMGGYNSVGGGEQTRIDEPAVEQQLQPTIPTGRVFAGMCIRNGCTNRAIDNKGWDNEYCSNECVVSHCRDVFSAWVSSRQHLSMPFPVK